MQLTEEITLVLWRKGGGRREDTDAYFRWGIHSAALDACKTEAMVVCEGLKECLESIHRCVCVRERVSVITLDQCKASSLCKVRVFNTLWLCKTDCRCRFAFVDMTR